MVKKIVRLFSAYLTKETGEKLLCYAQKFYLGVVSILLVKSQVMTILRNLERMKARRKADSKETRCKIDLTKSLESVDLSQQTHQVTSPSHSETILGLLDYETTRDAGTSGFKKSGSNYRKYSPNERYNKGEHALEFGTKITLRRFKAEFPQLRESTVRSIRSRRNSMRKNLKLH